MYNVDNWMENVSANAYKASRLLKIGALVGVILTAITFLTELYVGLKAADGCGQSGAQSCTVVGSQIINNLAYQLIIGLGISAILFAAAIVLSVKSAELDSFDEDEDEDEDEEDEGKVELTKA
jgi:hypothetical protein